MLWYLLYPLRGTTNAPDLAPDHPLRSAATRYGICVARNVAVTLLLSVALLTAFVYPVPFLYTSDFADGAAHIPRHVWTNAQPLADGSITEPDVVMRSAWVHGSYLKALQRDVLLDALELQDKLLGPTYNFHPRRSTNLSGPAVSAAGLSLAQRDAFHIVNGLTNQSWLFTSPLLYWGGDKKAVMSDTDVLATVNRKRAEKTFANITLRPSVVFSGTRFEDRSLIAVDALVISLIHLPGSVVGQQWDRNLASLTTRPNTKWSVHPADEHSARSQLYVFQFLPISVQDSLMLVVSYTLTCAYVVQNLSKVPAIKSRPGLMLAVIAQIFASIMSSFTICAVLNIDLSRIPRAAYPIVILSMSLENLLRLINTVIATDLEDSTSSRIGDAFGRTTHIALASVGEHLFLLWGVSNFVAPGLSDFCVFLGIAIVFDFGYLSTFFLSVLSIEVRRTELGEAIEKASSMRRSLRSSVSPPPSYEASLPLTIPQESWLGAVLRGRVDVSTRIAGTAIFLGFIVIAQWHFLGNEGIIQYIFRLLSVAKQRANGCTNAHSSLPKLYQACSPESWLQLQDHETAGEIINVIKPHAHHYVARVYEPIMFVSKDATRQLNVAESPFLSAVYDFTRRQWKSYITAILAVAATVRLFVCYLLHYGIAENLGEMETVNEPVLSEKTLEQGHALDVALMAASPDGLVVSVGLDRWIRVWNVPCGGTSYLLGDQDASLDVPFPVIALAIDDDSVWLAILSSYMVTLWSLETKRWGSSIPVDLRGHKPEAFFFTPTRKGPCVHSIVLVRHDGMLVELWADTSESSELQVCKSPLVNAVLLYSPASVPASRGEPLSILTTSRSGCIHQITPALDGWVSKEVKQHASREEIVHSLVAVPQLSVYLAVKTISVDVVDCASSAIIHTFKAAVAIQARSLRCLYSIRRYPPAGFPELGYFSLVFTSADTGNCIMQTYLPQAHDGSIALQPDLREGTPATIYDFRCTLGDARQVTAEVPGQGKWEALPNGSIIGVRRQADVVLSDRTSDHATGHDKFSGKKSGTLRRRGLQVLSDATTAHLESQDVWEAWSVCSVVDFCSNSNKSRSYTMRPLEMKQGDLLVTEPGPMVQVGAGTVAIGLGTSIKIISMGPERFGSPAEMLEAASGQMMQASAVGSRRRKRRSSHKGA